ncbi:MAG: nuclear transport factor 2 family protein [Tahibacter sp.]
MDKVSFSWVACLVLPAMALAAKPPAQPTPAKPPVPPTPAAAPAFVVPAPAAPMSARECAVWRRERSFSESVARHDAKAFVEHLHADAVFIGGGPIPTRGRDAVLREWMPLIDGKEIALHWYPGAVHIAGNEKIALSHGPFWIEDLSPNPAQHYVTGSFISTWVEGADGTWHVLYDGGGGGRPRPISAEDVAKLVASLPKECPRASPAS